MFSGTADYMEFCNGIKWKHWNRIEVLREEIICPDQQTDANKRTVKSIPFCTQRSTWAILNLVTRTMPNGRLQPKKQKAPGQKRQEFLLRLPRRFCPSMPINPGYRFQKYFKVISSMPCFRHRSWYLTYSSSLGCQPLFRYLPHISEHHSS